MFKPKHPFAFLPVSMGLIVLVLSLFLVVIKTADTSPASTQNPNVKAGSDQVSLVISPALGNFAFKAGSFYPSGLVLFSDTQEVKRVDVKIHFDPTLVMVDTELNPGTAMDNVAVVQVDNAAGTIFFSAENFEPKTASGILLGFRFQPKKVGTVRFSVEYAGSGLLDDSNVITAENADALTLVEDAEYVIRQ